MTNLWTFVEPLALNHIVLDGVSSMSQPKVGVQKANLRQNFCFFCASVK